MAKKPKKSIFWLFLSLCRTASRSYRLSQINALRIIQSYLPKDQSSKFSLKILRIGDFEKWPFFESAILIFFASFSWKQVKVYWLARMGRNFDAYPGFQPKITPPKHFSRECISSQFLAPLFFKLTLTKVIPMTLVAHWFGHVKFRILNLWFDFFQLRLLEGNNNKYSNQWPSKK